MKKLIGSLVVAGLLSGCLVRTRPSRGHSSRTMSKDCPPSYHWNGYNCVHNGRGHGNGKRR